MTVCSKQILSLRKCILKFQISIACAQLFLYNLPNGRVYYVLRLLNWIPKSLRDSLIEALSELLSWPTVYLPHRKIATP